MHLIQKTVALFVFIAPFFLNAAVYESTGHQASLYEKDIIILKKTLEEKPKDRTALARMVKLNFALENFEETILYSDKYLSHYSSLEISYLKALSLANLSRYKEAVAVINQILANKTINDKDRRLLENKRIVLEKSITTGGEPSDAKKVSWGKDCYVVGIHDRTYSLLAMDTVRKKLFRYCFRDDTVSDDIEIHLIDGLDIPSIINITISNDDREIFATLSNPAGGLYLMHRYFDIDNEKWSSWSKPDFAKKGTINGYANLLSDGEHVIFASNRDSVNGIDLYFTSRSAGGSWNEAVKISGVNTPFDECSLYLHPDGETVYFASNGISGYGGHDLYTGKLSSSKGSFSIGSITNLTQVNSYRNESFPLYSVFNTDNAYFTFIKTGIPAIYTTTISQIRPAPVSFLEVRVFDAETKQPVRSNAKMIRLNDRTSGISLSNATDKHGNSRFAVRRGARYTISITAEGYAYKNESIDIGPDDDFITKTYYIDKGKVKKGYILVVENIYFDPASFVIRDESEQGLQELLSFMKKNPGVKIEIAGHTDNTGSYEYNINLSNNRAKSIAAYLNARGIKKTRISVKGFGYSQNLKPNDTEEGRQMNRRVEITVIASE